MAEKFKAGEVSSRELVDAHAEVIEAAEPAINAFLKLSFDQAREQADAIDAKRAAGEELASLAGVPIAIKDMIVTKGIETTAASKILEGWVPPYDATVITRLKKAGLPILGKTNLDEFAQGSSTEHSAYGNTQNPWDTDPRSRWFQGGGSAAAVAAFEAPLALGTDTGGSIRPARCLYWNSGRESQHTVAYLVSAQLLWHPPDQIGPVSRTVLDSALLQETIGGHDPHDSTSLPGSAPAMVAAARAKARSAILKA